MGRVRRFYGHEGVVPPTGFRSRSAAAPASAEAEEVDELVADDVNGEPIELVGELVEDGAEVPAAGVAVRLDGSEVETGEDGIPVLTAEDEAGPVELDGAAVEVDENGGEELAEDDDEASEAEALPDDEWTGPELDAFAEEHGIDLTGAKKTKGDKLARILESLKEK